ncbi:MAG: hypothetical protein KAJ66_05570 [Candidatus Omnitrophica bacterium]|nr:hypothetical protein [Candidatus Omnitrophota bacterium]
MDKKAIYLLIGFFCFACFPVALSADEKGDIAMEDIFLNFDYQKNIVINSYVVSEEDIADLFKESSELSNFKPKTFSELQDKELFLVLKLSNKANSAFWGMLNCKIDGIIRDTKVYLNLCGAHQKTGRYVIPLKEKPVNIDEQSIPNVSTSWEKLYVK